MANIELENTGGWNRVWIDGDKDDLYFHIRHETEESDVSVNFTLNTEELKNTIRILENG